MRIIDTITEFEQPRAKHEMPDGVDLYRNE
jgi:hypothetical protein